MELEKQLQLNGIERPKHKLSEAVGDAGTGVLSDLNAADLHILELKVFAFLRVPLLKVFLNGDFSRLIVHYGFALVIAVFYVQYRTKFLT